MGEVSMNQMRVLVTGGCGFIGHHLVRRLLADGHEVMVLDDLSTGSFDRLPEHSALDFRLGTVLDESEIAAVARRRIDLVMHLAGVVGTRLVASTPEVAYKVSADGTRNVLALLDAPIVLFSSSAVYGLEAHESTTEDQAVRYENVCSYDGGRAGYAAGKWKAEQLVLAAVSEGRQAMIVRPFNVVGSGQSGRYGMVLPTFLESAFRGMPLTVHGDGQQVRCFSAVEVFVDVLSRLLRTEVAWRPDTNVINVGCPEPMSIRHLAELVLQVTGARAPMHFVPYEEVFPGRRDVQWRVPNLQRLESLVGPTTWPSAESIVRNLCSPLSRDLELCGLGETNRVVRRLV
jgi:UDP-glucose 4-epimerase